MKNKKIILIPILILLLFIPIFVYFLNKNNKQTKVTKILKQAKDLSDIKVEKFRLQKYFSKKNDKWILTAQNGSVFRNQNIVKCNNAKFKFILENQLKATIKAPTLIFKLKENIIMLDGGIKSVLLNNSTSDNGIN